MKVALDKGAFPPVRAHDTDAGIDLMARHAVNIFPHSSAVVGTGTHVQLPKGTCGLLVSKSGLNTKHSITSTGLIDEGYDGEIMVKLYNHGSDWYHVAAGDKISQLVVIPCLYEPIEIVDSIEGGDRGSNGFGSTGK